MDKPSIWVTANPESLKVTNPKANAAGLEVALGVTSKLTTTVQDAKPDVPAPEALPPLSIVPTLMETTV